MKLNKRMQKFLIDLHLNVKPDIITEKNLNNLIKFALVKELPCERYMITFQGIDKIKNVPIEKFYDVDVKNIS